MAKKKKTTAVKKYKKKKQPLNHQISRIFREREFSPLTQILNDIPRLEPEERVKVCLQLMTYLYPKPKAVDTGPKKKGPAIQVNTQVNMPDKQEKIESPKDVVRLLAEAEGKEDK